MPDLSDGSWSEIDSNNNSPPPNGWPEGMLPSGVNDAARADRGALKRFWNRANPLQLITPAAGALWRFVTDNPSYPTGYTDGELYCFRPNAAGIGNDQFQVNALPPKPVLNHATFGGGGWRPTIAHEFRDHVALAYDASLNGGTGAFALLNPFIPISGDGVGGLNVPTGNLTVSGNAAIAGNLTVSGTLTGSGGINVPGDLTVPGNLTVSGNATTTGNQTIGGNVTTSDITAHTITANGGVQVNAGGLYVVGGGANITGAVVLPSGDLTVTTGNITAHTITANGGVQVNAGGLYVVSGGSNITGGLTLPTGDLTVTTGNTDLAGTLHVGNSVSLGTTDCRGNLHVAGNVTIDGTLNGHPAMAMFDQLNELTARVKALEEQLR